MPVVITETEVIFFRYLKCVAVVGGQVLTDILRHMYSKLETSSGTMPVRKYLESMGDKECSNYEAMDYYLDCNIMEKETELDITFSFRVMRDKDICKEWYEKLPAEGVENVSILAKERNLLHHHYGIPINTEDKVSTLKNRIKNIYENAGNIYGVNFDDNLTKITNQIDRIVKDTSDLENEIKDYRQSKTFKLNHYGFKELHSYYCTLKTHGPCKWIDDFDQKERFTLEKVFTPPKLWDNKHKGFIHMEDLLQVKMKNKKIPTITLIKGLAGSGKTSLSRYVTYSWYSKTNAIKCLKDFEFVLLLEIGKSTSDNISEILREELMKNTCRQFDSGDIIPSMQCLDVLFIIDGYDERADRGKSLLTDILEKFGSKRIILLTRLDYESEIEHVAKLHKTQLLSITLKGFDDTKQIEFSKKVFQMVEKDDSDFLTYLDGRGRVLDVHLTLPLTISLLIILWMENPKIVNKITTATCLYYEIFCLFRDRLARRLISNLKGRNYNALMAIFSDILHDLGEEAWSMLRNGEGCVLKPESKDKLDRICITEEVDEVEFFSAFLMCEIDHSTPGTKNYSFIHRTQMEYLASEFLADSIKKGKLKDFTELDEQVSDWKQHTEVLVYLIGNMAKYGVLKKKTYDVMKLVKKTDIQSENYCYWWKLISESQIEADIPVSPGKPIIYKKLKHPEIAKHIENNYLTKSTNWKLDSENVSAGLRLMSLVSPSQLLVSHLDITISQGVNPCKIPDFYDALSAVGIHRKIKEKKTIVNVELHLFDQQNINSEETSDKFLKALIGWAELTNFTGSLSEVADFSKFKKLNINCLVKSPNILHSFAKHSGSIKKLRITFGFEPSTCPLESLVDLEINGDLELSIPRMRDEHLNWLIKSVRRLSRNGLRNLYVEQSEFAYKSILDLVKSLNGTLKNRLVITSPDFKKNEKETLEKKAKFVIEWED